MAATTHNGETALAELRRAPPVVRASGRRPLMVGGSLAHRIAASALIGGLALALLACGGSGRDPRPLAPPERAPAPWLAAATPTLRNALAGLTQEPVRTRVKRAFLGTSYALLEVTDDDAGMAWVVAPAIAATPTAVVTIGEYVPMDVSAVKMATDATPPDLGDAQRVLLASDIFGPDVTLSSRGEEAVLDPLLPPIDPSGVQAQEVKPVGPRIAELHEKRLALTGTPVHLRAQVWVVIPRVAGLNWGWVRDGSAEGRRGMVLVGTRQTMEPGAVVEFQGVLTADRLLGGRVHPVVLERARIVPSGNAAAPTAAPNAQAPPKP